MFRAVENQFVGFHAGSGVFGEAAPFGNFRIEHLHNFLGPVFFESMMNPSMFVAPLDRQSQS